MFLTRWRRRFTQVASSPARKASSTKPGRSLRFESLEYRSLMAGMVDASPWTGSHLSPTEQLSSLAPTPSAALVGPSTVNIPTPNSMRHSTVTVTLQSTNDAPPLQMTAPSQPVVVDGMKSATVTVTLQATNDTPARPIA